MIVFMGVVMYNRIPFLAILMPEHKLEKTIQFVVYQ